MRFLLWFTMGYAAASALGTYLIRGNGMLIAALVCVLLMLAGFRFRQAPVIKRGLALLLGCTVGCTAFFAYESIVLGPAKAADGQIMPLTIRVTDYSWDTDYGSAADGVTELNGREYKLRFYLNDRTDLEPGDIIRINAKLRLTDEGGQREPTFHRTSGILLLGYQRQDMTLIEGEPTWRDYPAIWRNELKTIIETCFAADTFAFAKALLLGDKTDLTYAQTTDFSVSGISHIVAVSGLHVSILCALIFVVSRQRRYLTAVIGIPVLVLFAALVGFTPSVNRAVLMQILMMLAVVVDREYDPPTALAFACLVMLIHCPLTIASVGFQLSVASVAGIFLFYEKLNGWLQKYLPGKGKTLRGRMERWFTSSVAVTFSATVMTVPLCAVYFGTVSLIGALTNLLVLFVISAIFYGVGLVCLLGAFSILLGTYAANLVSWPIRYVLTVAATLAKVPMAAVYTASPYIVLWLLFAYALIAWVTFSRKKRPALASAIAVIGLSISLMLSFLETLTCDYRVTAVDVGQGQCLILQSEGSTFLVDCGGDYDDGAADEAARLLLSQGISRIDGLILTHYDRDHAGGVPYLAHRIAIERIYLPLTEDADGLLKAVLSACDEQIPIDSDITISFGDTQIRIFPAKNAGSGNDSCASVLFQREKCDTLITGDLNAAAERQLLADHDLPDLEVLIAGHHGSKYSTCAELLAATAPDVVIISVGADNSYGHPAPEVLERLEETGCAVYRTDKHGTITYRG